jgi:hypothetical protein
LKLKDYSLNDRGEIGEVVFKKVLPDSFGVWLRMQVSQ